MSNSYNLQHVVNFLTRLAIEISDPEILDVNTIPGDGQNRWGSRGGNRSQISDDKSSWSHDKHVNEGSWQT